MMNNNLRDFDNHSTLKNRRNTGKFFTNQDLGEYTANIIRDLVKPEIIVEPFVGGGSLILPFSENKITCIANDIETDSIKLLKQCCNNNYFSFYSDNFITKPIKEIYNDWKIPLDLSANFLVYSNPPFGTRATNRLVLKNNEIHQNDKSRKIKINYGGLENLYGKGDLVLPSIGKMIEVIKHRKEGYLCFYSPFGIFCERLRYLKLLKQLLGNFNFIYGEIFSGDKFHGVNKDKPISFSLWKFKLNSKENYKDMKFTWKNKKIAFKRAITMKESWKYDTRKKIIGEIGVQGNERFNSPVPKIFHSKIEKGGSELHPSNIKIKLNIENIPDELIYGLWSISVGNRAIVKHPVYIDNAYTHLPDFTKKESLEILTYSILYALISEIKNNYTDNKIGFFGNHREFRFGGDRLTKGVKYLIENYGSCNVGDFTIKGYFVDLENRGNLKEDETNIRREIKKEIEKRLFALDYWGFIPLPLKITE